MRFCYDGQIDPKTLQRSGFGRYFDFLLFKISVGYFKDDLPFGKHMIFCQESKSAMIQLYKQGHFHKSWNSFSEQKILNFLENDEVEPSYENQLDLFVDILKLGKKAQNKK
jgi:hypothetical protein